MTTVDLDGLSNEELGLVARLVDLIRRSRESDSARAEFQAFWSDWKDSAPDVDPKEVDRLAEDAVRYARRGV